MLRKEWKKSRFETKRRKRTSIDKVIQPTTFYAVLACPSIRERA